MAIYAVGDVQGCFDELDALLKKIQFQKSDRLWFVGDLVNRGPKSLEVLRFVRGLGKRAVVVLGNHDLHLVTQHEGFERPRKDDSFTDVLQARDRDKLVDWLRTRPMLHAEGGYAMVHAGLLPGWSVAKALKLAGGGESAPSPVDEPVEHGHGGLELRALGAPAGQDGPSQPPRDLLRRAGEQSPRNVHGVGRLLDVADPAFRGSSLHTR